jgi:FixJ family two-component response regulator
MIDSIPTVFVVDDDHAVCKGLVRLLESAGYDAESFTSARIFLEHWEENPRHGCVLLDISMPGLDGIELQRRINTLSCTIPIIFITGHGDIPTTVTAMKAGAVNFFTKPLKDEDLLTAIREAIERDKQERIERDSRASVIERYESLTPREREVMRLVVRGMLNKQIAYELGISEKTIKIHRGRVMQKMKAQSVADLVREAGAIGLQSGLPL